MVYHSLIKVVFPEAAEDVYAELTNLDRHLMWNSGLVNVSRSGSMSEGMEYETVSMVLGRENRAKVRVGRLIPNSEIELSSDTGEIIFHIRYRLITQDVDQTEVVCTIRFELAGIALNLAHPVIESMAKARLQGDLETLRALMSS